MHKQPCFWKENRSQLVMRSAQNHFLCGSYVGTMRSRGPNLGQNMCTSPLGYLSSPSSVISNEDFLIRYDNGLGCEGTSTFSVTGS